MLIPRPRYYRKIQEAFRFLNIAILIGARQVGKTSIMKSYQFEGRVVFVNGQDLEEIEIFDSLTVLTAYLESKLGREMEGLFMIDEFQYIPKISTTLKLLGDRHDKLKILCSGSSSLDIIQNIEESLAGRVRIINVYGLSFDEYLSFYDDNLYKEFDTYNYDTPVQIVNRRIKNVYLDYLIFGSFPRVALARQAEHKISLINDIYQTYLLKDVRSYVKNEDSIGFNRLMKLIASQIGNLLNKYNLSKLSGLTRHKTEEYLDLLEQMFIIKMVAPWFSNPKKSIIKMPKLYFLDNGLRNMIINNFQDVSTRQDGGALFENALYSNLLSNLHPTADIKFFRSLQGAEIDYIVNHFGQVYCIEAKFKSYKKAVIPKIIKIFLEQEKISKSFIINRDYKKDEDNISFLPGYLSKIMTDEIAGKDGAYLMA